MRPARLWAALSLATAAAACLSADYSGTLCNPDHTCVDGYWCDRNVSDFRGRCRSGSPPGGPDGGAAGGLDAGKPDAGPKDAGPVDAGSQDAGSGDGGAADAGQDAGEDAGTSDGGETDSGISDAGVPDAGAPDASVDAGEADAGPLVRDGTSPERSAVSCAAIKAVAAIDPTSGSYWIDPQRDGGAVELYCDMDNGGWTLVGKTDGLQTMHTSWLVTDHEVANLRNTSISSASYACIDAVEMAVTSSTELRLSNAALTRWVQWPMLAGRSRSSWWRHSATQPVIANAGYAPVSVVDELGTASLCRQNIYGIDGDATRGGGYPSTQNPTAVSLDGCMSVAVLPLSATDTDGFLNSAPGFDAPRDDVDWPNAGYGFPPHLLVWLK